MVVKFLISDLQVIQINLDSNVTYIIGHDRKQLTFKRLESVNEKIPVRFMKISKHRPFAALCFRTRLLLQSHNSDLISPLLTLLLII